MLLGLLRHHSEAPPEMYDLHKLIIGYMYIDPKMSWVQHACVYITRGVYTVEPHLTDTCDITNNSESPERISIDFKLKDNNKITAK